MCIETKYIRAHGIFHSHVHHYSSRIIWNVELESDELSRSTVIIIESNNVHKITIIFTINARKQALRTIISSVGTTFLEHYLLHAGMIEDHTTLCIPPIVILNLPHFLSIPLRPWSVTLIANPSLTLSHFLFPPPSFPGFSFAGSTSHSQ